MSVPNFRLPAILEDTIAYLSLGSNLGDRSANLKNAIAKLAGHGAMLAASSVYETEPVEIADQPWFLNCVVGLRTRLAPEQLLQAALAIEQEMGRQRVQKKGPRTVDIDILLFGDLVRDELGLTIPHPAMAERRFVLEPMLEIAPDVRHPVLQRSMRELLDELPAGQEVRRVGD